MHHTRYPVTTRERLLEEALRELTELFEACERVVRPRGELFSLEVWARLERAAGVGRRLRDVEAIAVACDSALATGVA